MSTKRSRKIKIAAVKQKAHRGHLTGDVVEKPGDSVHSSCNRTKRYGGPEEEHKAADSQADEIRA
jgi:hypothetical protein